MSDEKDQESNDEEIYVIDDSDTGSEEIKRAIEEAMAAAGDRGLDEGDGSAAPSTPDTASERGELDEETRELQDRYLRLRADFENSRRRFEREKADYHRYAKAELIREILPVLDNFERAISSAGDRDDELLRGVEMIHRQLADVLIRSGVKTVEEDGVPFDPAIHEAILRDEESELPPNTVVEVLQRGYLLNDRLIRPALVRVAVGGSEIRHDSEPEA